MPTWSALRSRTSSLSVGSWPIALSALRMVVVTEVWRVLAQPVVVAYRRAGATSDLAWTGKVNENVLPSPMRLTAQIRPPCPSTMLFEM